MINDSMYWEVQNLRKQLTARDAELAAIRHRLADAERERDVAQMDAAEARGLLEDIHALQGLYRDMIMAVEARKTTFAILVKSDDAALRYQKADKAVQEYMKRVCAFLAPSPASGKVRCNMADRCGVACSEKIPHEHGSGCSSCSIIKTARCVLVEAGASEPHEGEREAREQTQSHRCECCREEVTIRNVGDSWYGECGHCHTEIEFMDDEQHLRFANYEKDAEKKRLLELEAVERVIEAAYSVNQYLDELKYETPAEIVEGWGDDKSIKRLAGKARRQRRLVKEFRNALAALDALRQPAQEGGKG